MTSHQKAHQICDAAVVGGLIQIVIVALTERFPTPQADLDDVDQLIEALHTLRPNCTDFDFLDGMMQLTRKNWIDATAIFRSLVSQAIRLPASRGLLMYCMRQTGDPDWRTEADQLRQEYDLADVALVARSLIAGEDLSHAIESAKRTGVFVLPESVQEVQAIFDEKRAGKAHAAAPQTSTSDDTMLMRYGLRI